MTRVAPPRAYPSPAAFRQWLVRNHATATELVVRLFKLHAADQGMGYSDALDEALCFGWIDGVRHAVDEISFSVRFTPRKTRSIWSRVNVKRVEALIAAGRIQPAGLVAFSARDQARTGVYSFERSAAVLPPPFAGALRGNKAAKAWFAAQPSGYRRTCIHWVMSAKREETRRRRLTTLITCSAAHLAVPPLRRR